MRVLLLCAGYGTRLEREILVDRSGSYRDLVGLSKALVPVGDSDVVTRWLKQCRACGLKDEDIYLVSNDKHHAQFQKWAARENFPLNNILNDGSTSNETRLGAVGDIQFAIKQMGANAMQDALLVLAGDTLFFADFQLGDVLKRFNDGLDKIKSNGTTGDEEIPFGLVLTYQLADHNEVSKRGIVEVNADAYVTKFLEKPRPSMTESNCAVPAFYIYSPAALRLIDEFIATTPMLELRDAPGTFLQWLCGRNVRIQTMPISGRYDIGGLADLVEARMSLSSSQ